MSETTVGRKRKQHQDQRQSSLPDNGAGVQPVTVATPDNNEATQQVLFAKHHAYSANLQDLADHQSDALLDTQGLLLDRGMIIFDGTGDNEAVGGIGKESEDNSVEKSDSIRYAVCCLLTENRRPSSELRHGRRAGIGRPRI